MRGIFKAALMGVGVIAGTGVAAGPDIAQVLALKPIQAGVICDTPAPETWAKCKLEVMKASGQSGWILRDSRGLTVRKLVDTNADNVVDQRSFYMNGLEVYREIDGNHNRTPDEFRWFNAAGSRWGVDASESGKIEKWKSISAEEATAEALAGVAARDFDRLRCVLVTEEDVRSLGLDDKAVARVNKALAQAQADYRKLCEAIPAESVWQRFDGHNPMTVSGSDIGAAKDIVLYHNGTIIADVKGKTQWLRASEVVRVGEVWKLTSVPVVIDSQKPTESMAVLVPSLDQKMIAAEGQEDSTVEPTEEIQALVAQLQKHDEGLPKGEAAPRALIAYHTKRSELCARIGSKSMKPANREHWYKQSADSIDAAIQTNEYSQGIAILEQYSEQFARTSWGTRLAAYFKYRALNASYALEIAKSSEQAKVQDKFLANLVEFIKAYPTSEDAADALWQVGNGMEFVNKDHEALTYYKRLVAEQPKSTFAAKAAGAIKRIECVGHPFRLVGSGLAGYKVDTAEYKGKVLVVVYWATWCEPCKAEMPRLARLREKYGPQGCEIIGVALDAEAEAPTAHCNRNQYSWPQIHEKGSMDSAPAVQYGVVSLPTTFLVDEDGRVLNRNLQTSQLEIEMEKALAKKIASSRN